MYNNSEEVTHEFYLLSKDKLTYVSQFLGKMRELTLLSPIERKAMVSTRDSFKQPNIDRLYRGALNEVTETKDIKYLEDLRRVYLDKYNRDFRYKSPTLSEVETIVLDNLSCR